MKGGRLAMEIDAVERLIAQLTTSFAAMEPPELGAALGQVRDRLRLLRAAAEWRHERLALAGAVLRDRMNHVLMHVQLAADIAASPMPPLRHELRRRLRESVARGCEGVDEVAAMLDEVS